MGVEVLGNSGDYCICKVVFSFSITIRQSQMCRVANNLLAKMAMISLIFWPQPASYKQINRNPNGMVCNIMQYEIVSLQAFFHFTNHTKSETRCPIFQASPAILEAH